MKVRITQIDGKLPNLALMRLAHYHRSLGDEVIFRNSISKDLFEPDYDLVYGSSIFKFSEEKTLRFKTNFPNPILGGTGIDNSSQLETWCPGIGSKVDYTDYPDFKASIGFLIRGCRLKCGFCVVPEKEGKPYQEQTITDLYRGHPYPKQLHLLDNDFFGIKNWRDRIAEIRANDFKICFSQGINIRLVNKRIAEALASIKYYDSKFKKRRIYTAWDNLGDEKPFMRGVDYLVDAGIPTRHIMAYMLIGYDPKETMDVIQYRFEKMVERGVLPYPMVYDRSKKVLCDFQRWAIRGYYRFIPFVEYNPRKT